MRMRDPTARWELATLLQELLEEHPNHKRREHVEYVIQLLKKPDTKAVIRLQFEMNVVAAEVACALIDAREPIDLTPSGECLWQVTVPRGSRAEEVAHSGIDAGKAIFAKRMQRSYAERDARPQESLVDFLDLISLVRVETIQRPAEEYRQLLKNAEAHVLRLRKAWRDAEDLVDAWRARAEQGDEGARILEQSLAAKNTR